MGKSISNNYVETILNNDSLTKDEKVKMINFVYENYRQKLDEDLRNYLIKIWAGAILEIGSAALPYSGVGKVGAMAGQKLLQKAIGKKLAQELGSGAASGLASGGVFGAGRGMIEDKNPLITALQDAGLGMFAGGGIGAIGGNLNRVNAGNTLKKYQLNNIIPDDYKKYKQQAQHFYKDYLQGRTIVNKDIGNIDITRKGLDEIFSKNVELAQVFPDLINDLRKADYVETNALYKVRKDKATEKFHILKNGENKHFIAEDKLGNKKFYLTKKYTTDQGTPSRVEGTSSGGAFIINGTPQAASPGSQNANSTPAYLYHNQALEPESNNIINDNSKNVNPAPMIIPPQILQNLQEDNQPSFLLEGSVEMNIDQNGNHIFTPEEIGQMNSDEFSANESAIMKQLQSGLIGQQIKDFANFTNPITGDGRIFSREDIGQMSGDEYSANESAIIAQLKSIGIPAGGELEASSIFGGGTVYVRPYTREDGTEVRGYWRSAPSV